MLKTAAAFGLAAFAVFAPVARSQALEPRKNGDRQSQALPKCDQQKVAYSPFDKEYSRRLILLDVSNSENPPEVAKKVYSPENMKWSATLEPDTSKPGPWDSHIYFGSDADENIWKLSLHDNIGTDFKWLSEKLVFIRIWWGRIYATDLILDLDAHKFLYREMAHYGGVTGPCQ